MADSKLKELERAATRLKQRIEEPMSDAFAQATSISQLRIEMNRLLLPDDVLWLVDQSKRAR